MNYIYITSDGRISIKGTGKDIVALVSTLIKYSIDKVISKKEDKIDGAIDLINLIRDVVINAIIKDENKGGKI